MITPQDVRNIYLSWKSTIIGILGLAIAITLAWMTLPPKASIPVIVMAILRALVQFLQQDAGVTMAVLPGATTPQVVASHEVPNNPRAIPITQDKTGS